MKYLFVFFLCINCSLTAHSTTLQFSESVSQAIDTTEIVSIGNSKQYIRIKGSSSESPVLLFLNGGPGDSVLGTIDKMFGALQKEFVVVLWDQRQTGQTRQLNNPKEVLTQTRFEKDTKSLVHYLLKRFGKEKIVLVGHSYGTSLGFKMAKQNPELLHAYIATTPMIHQIESERIALEMLKEHARRTANSKAIEELGEVMIPFQTGEQLYFARKWLFDFDGKKFARKKGFKKNVLSWAAAWLPLFNEASRANLFETPPNYDCPIYFILGDKDYQTNYTLSERYFQQITAPKKELFIIKNAGHLIPFEHSNLFQDHINLHILPEIIQGED